MYLAHSVPSVYSVALLFFYLHNVRVKMLFLLVVRFKFFEAAFQFRL